MIAEFHAKALAGIVGAKRVAAAAAGPREAGGHLARPIDPAEDIAHFGDPLGFARAIRTRGIASEEQPGRTGLTHGREDPTGGLRTVEGDDEDGGRGSFHRAKQRFGRDLVRLKPRQNG